MLISIDSQSIKHSRKGKICPSLFEANRHATDSIALSFSWLPIGVRGKMSLMFESAGRRLDALPPQAEVSFQSCQKSIRKLTQFPHLRFSLTP